MIEISIALVIIAGMAFYLVNKFLDMKFKLNIEATNLATIAALEDRIHKFDERINNTWGTISSTKQELEALKLSIGLKGNR